MNTDVLIVGGGLAGLALADALHRAGRSFLLVEGRNRLGGRIKTEEVCDARFDMGPAWYWPGQPRMEAMVDRFALQRFDQFAQGALSYEDERGQVQRGRGYASMQGSYRVAGGLIALTHALAQGLPQDQMLMGYRVSGFKLGAELVETSVEGRETIFANHVVLAVPPRVAAGLNFDPVMPDDVMQAMAEVPTWMAGQAKAVAVYDTPFWRDTGLSGDAMSRYGPMVEIHDASPVDSSLGALFGFIGVPPAARTDQAVLQTHVLAQLGRLFGDQAAKPKALFIKDWAADGMTATDADLAPVSAHPSYGLPPALAGLWDGQVLFGGTEVARSFGGYLEGALEAAEAAFHTLSTKVDTP